MFKYRVVYKRVSPEVKRIIKKLGYKLEREQGPYIVCDVDGIFSTESLLTGTYIDCGSNFKLFLSIAALRDDCDYMQWFKTKDGDIYKYRQMNINDSGDIKLTVDELIKEFRVDDYGYVPLKYMKKVNEFLGPHNDIYLLEKTKYLPPLSNSPMIAMPGDIVKNFDFCEIYDTDDYIPAPTLEQFRGWLEERGIFLSIYIDPYFDTLNFNVQRIVINSSDGSYNNNLCTGLFGDNAEFLSREDALEFGIIKTIEECLLGNVCS